MTQDLDTVRRLEDAGAAAIVMHSLFEEQLVAEQWATDAQEQPAHAHPEAMSYFPTPPRFIIGSDDYLDQLEKVKRAVDIPVLGSLNGFSAGGWVRYAGLIEEAGADALELNIYDLATDSQRSGQEVEKEILELVTQIEQRIRIPIAVKLSPFYTALSHFAARLAETRVDGLVLFNRFYQPDIDAEELEVMRVHLSDPSELLLRLHWLEILWGKVNADLAVTGGVHRGLDVIKAVMGGASAVQMVSALLRHGPGHLRSVRQELIDWLEEHEYHSLEQVLGSMSLLRCPSPHAYERVNYMQLLNSWQAPAGWADPGNRVSDEA